MTSQTKTREGTVGNKLSKWVVAFADGDETMRDVLGGKGVRSPR